MNDNISILHNIDLDAHIHMNWFEIEKTDYYVVIMCPEGCRRMLKADGGVMYYNKEKFIWEKY